MQFTQIDVVLAGLILLLAIIVTTAWARRRRSRRLKSRFISISPKVAVGPRDRPAPETIWAERQKQISGEVVQPLSSAMRYHFIATWRAIQVQFVNEPRQAVTRADDLLGEVMVACGYPVHDFAQRAKALAVDHADVVQHYRTAHNIAISRTRGAASPENLRLAMVNFGALFDDLVNEPVQYARQPVAPGGRA